MNGNCEKCLSLPIRKAISLEASPGHCMICKKPVKGNVRKDRDLTCGYCTLCLTYRAGIEGEDYDREDFLAGIGIQGGIQVASQNKLPANQSVDTLFKPVGMFKTSVKAYHGQRRIKT